MIGIAFHPFFYVGIIVVLCFAYVVLRSKPDINVFITAMNSVGSQPTALIVLIIGCFMLVLCKQYDLDSTIAGGIIGVASNMLTNMFVKQHQETSKTTQDTTIPNTPKTDDASKPE